MARTASLVAAFPISTTQISAAVSVTDENSRIYAIAQPTGTTAPSAAEVIAGLDGDGGATAVAANTVGLVPAGAVAGLTFPEAPSNATYDVYAVATDADGANEGAVDGPSVVTLADEFVAAPYPTAPDFPANPNPVPPNGVASTLPDADVETLNDWWSTLVSLLGGTDGDVKATVNVAGTTLRAGVYPIGGPAPTRAELVAGTGAEDFGSQLLTQDVEGTVALTPVSEGFYLFATFDGGSTVDADVLFVGEYSSVSGGAYTAWGTGVAISPVMPAGIEDWEGGNRTIAQIPVTVIISAN